MELMVPKERRATRSVGLTDPLRQTVGKPADAIKTGYLSKKGEVNPNWKRRYFMLSEQHLYYYKSPQDTRYTGAVQLLFSSCRKLTPQEKFELGEGNEHSFKIITPARVYFFKADSDDEADEWMIVITKVCEALWEQENRLAKDPSAIKTKPVLKQGWLLKQGNNFVKDWKQRWFILHKDSITYYKTQDDYIPLGTILLLNCSVKMSETVKDRKYCMEFVTPSRTFYAIAKDADDMMKWMDATKGAIAATLDHFFESNQQNVKTKKKATVPSNPPSTPNSALSTPDPTPPTPSVIPESPKLIYDPIASIDRQPETSGSYLVPTPFSPPSRTVTLNDLKRGIKTTSSEEGSQISYRESKTMRDLWGEILKLPENTVCCECNAPDPKWASINLGIFVCIECSGIHRSLGVHLSKVRSVDLDVWDVEMVEFMAGMGNKKAREIWEYSMISQDALRPTPDSPRQEKQKWIENKYVQRKYADPDIIKPEDYDFKPKEAAPKPNSAPTKEGFLTKMGPKEEMIKSWKKRWFVLKNNHLYYYVSREDSIPTGAIRLHSAKIKIASETYGKTHCFEICTRDRDYVISADDSSDMFLWIQTLNDSISYFDGIKVPTKIQPPVELKIDDKRKSMMLNAADMKRKGYLFKKGNNLIKDWKKRYCVIYKGSVYYYDNEEDPLPLGVIELDQAKLGMNFTLKTKGKKLNFELSVPGRTYYFYTEIPEEYEGWVKDLEAEIRKCAKKSLRVIDQGTFYQPMPENDLKKDEKYSTFSASHMRSASMDTTPGQLSSKSFIGNQKPTLTKQALIQSATITLDKVPTKPLPPRPPKKTQEPPTSV